MVRLGFLAASFAFLALTVTAAADQRMPGGGGYSLKPLVLPASTVPKPQPRAPYAMNYSQQIAQSLGVRDGGLELLPPPDRKTTPYAPSVSFNGSMLRLKWRP